MEVRDAAARAAALTAAASAAISVVLAQALAFVDDAPLDSALRAACLARGARSCAALRCAPADARAARRAVLVELDGRPLVAAALPVRRPVWSARSRLTDVGLCPLPLQPAAAPGDDVLAPPVPAPLAGGAKPGRRRAKVRRGSAPSHLLSSAPLRRAALFPLRLLVARPRWCLCAARRGRQPAGLSCTPREKQNVQETGPTRGLSPVLAVQRLTRRPTTPVQAVSQRRNAGGLRKEGL